MSSSPLASTSPLSITTVASPGHTSAQNSSHLVVTQLCRDVVGGVMTPVAGEATTLSPHETAGTFVRFSARDLPVLIQPVCATP